ncbi:MAG: ATP-binding protein [Bacillota bacterium]
MNSISRTMKELSLHILDIMQNSLAAGADCIELTIRENRQQDQLIIEIRDNGRGMDRDQQQQVTDPFVTSRQTREVGLGLPLLSEAARRCGGELKLESTPGEGTRVEAWFQYNHIDRAPLGDMPGTIVSLLAVNPELELVYRHYLNQRQFVFKTSEIRQELEGVALNHSRVLNWIEDYLRQGLKDLQKGDG